MSDEEIEAYADLEKADQDPKNDAGGGHMPELLMDIELEATLRFGSREMTLGEVLDLGPGDVIELDRQVDDAVDLLVGDRIVARGLAVLCNGKYGLRVTEVAELKMSLESVHCLF
jgi:flagellar motor switch protein FliN/FliY